MDSARYWIALLITASLPPGVLMWLLIHPAVAFWRRRGPVLTYMACFAMTVLMVTPVIVYRDAILRIEFGTNWLLIGLGVLLYAACLAIEIQCRRHLELAALVGLPEISQTRPSRLLSEGIYGKIRHPRYVDVVLGTFAFALFANYLAAYLVAIAIIPLLYLVVIFEERELLNRFGKDYEDYARRVPRFFPARR